MFIIFLSGDCSGPANFQAKRNTNAQSKKFVSVSDSMTSKEEHSSLQANARPYHKLAPYELTNVRKGACVRPWTSPTNSGYYSFYGATSISDVDLCKTKAETACTASGSGCTWVKFQTCTADQYATTTACDQSQVHTTNGKKTKFFVSGDADTCSRHTLTNPMCGDGRCDAVYTWNCVAPFCDPLVDYESERGISQMKWYSSKVSEKTTCPTDCKCLCSLCVHQIYLRQDVVFQIFRFFIYSTFFMAKLYWCI